MLKMKEVTKDGRFPLLQKPPRITELKEPINGHRVYIFADDPEDFAFGGNKVRFYEYLIPDIIEKKPEVLVTSGSRYSNHIRVTAEVSALLDIPCILLLTEEGNEEKTDNILLSEKAGAKIEYIGQFAALLKIGEYVKRLQEEGRKVYLIPNGGHTPGAVRAYKRVAEYALSELEKRRIVPAGIYLPSAGGTTHAGLLCAELPKIPPIYSVAVANTVKGCKKGIEKLIGAAKQYLPGNFQMPEISVLDCKKNDYGKPDGELRCLREELYRSDGVLLDPTYNINAFYGMREILLQTPGNLPVLYINTGGNTKLRGDCFY